MVIKPPNGMGGEGPFPSPPLLYPDWEAGKAVHETNALHVCKIHAVNRGKTSDSRSERRNIGFANCRGKMAAWFTKHKQNEAAASTN